MRSGGTIYACMYSYVVCIGGSPPCDLTLDYVTACLA